MCELYLRALCKSVQKMFRASCLTLKIKEFRCYEAKIEESEKDGSLRELNPGHLWLEPPVLCHWATTTRQPPSLMILYMYCIGGTERLSRTPGSHSVCAIRTPLGVDRKILSIRRVTMLSVFSHSKCSEHLASCWYYEAKPDNHQPSQPLYVLHRRYWMPQSHIW